MIILGIGGLLNDPACAVLVDGKLIAAVEQKKIARHWEAGSLPFEAVGTALAMAGAQREDVECLVLVRPFSASAESASHLALRAHFPNSRLVVMEHHLAHAASAWFASPFEEGVVLTLDRAGDLRCGGRWLARGNDLRLDRELYFPDSLGDLYGRVTELLGLRANSDEHKIQWLSTASDDLSLKPLFDEIIGLDASGWPSFHRRFFQAHRVEQGGWSGEFYDRIGAPDGSVPTSRRAVIAAGLQASVEEAVFRMAGESKNLCLAGGLAFNALLVASLERSGKNVFVQPAAGNAGTALGAVFHGWHQVYGRKERIGFGTLCLGPEFKSEEIKQVLENCKLRFRLLLTSDELVETAVAALSEQKIIAWMQGRMEFGPRALGNRSILASPLNPYSTENLNIYIKHREPSRKFAASVPAELASRYFDVGPNAQYLATVGSARPEHVRTFEAALLGGDRIRVHVVRREDNPLYHRLLHAAGDATGLPVLYNTSFNLFSDPLVCTPRDAVRSFYSSGIDALFAGNFLVEK